MKSALELAMEKADDMVGEDEDYVKLTPEQIQAIDEVKKQYEAKWAEQEIGLKGKLEELARGVDPQTFAERRSQSQDEIRRMREQIFAERDGKIEAIRGQRKKS